jgi:hypothetical protein
MNIVISFCLFYNDNDYILRYMNVRFVKRFVIHSHFPAVTNPEGGLWGPIPPQNRKRSGGGYGLINCKKLKWNFLL